MYGRGIKRKIKEENGKYNSLWENDYFFIIMNNKLMCLICKTVVPVMKEYNVKRHYQQHHATFNSCTGELRKAKISALKSSLYETGIQFQRYFQNPSDIVKASFNISNLLAKKLKPFSEGEFIKECIIVAVQQICPKKVKQFSDIGLSRRNSLP